MWSASIFWRRSLFPSPFPPIPPVNRGPFLRDLFLGRGAPRIDFPVLSPPFRSSSHTSLPHNSICLLYFLDSAPPRFVRARYSPLHLRSTCSRQLFSPFLGDTEVRLPLSWRCLSRFSFQMTFQECDFPPLSFITLPRAIYLRFF